MQNHTRNARYQKRHQNRITRLGKYLWDIIRERVLTWHFGKNRKTKRQEQKLFFIQQSRFDGTQHSRDKARRKAKIKARNRRNRKQARALHQLQRKNNL